MVKNGDQQDVIPLADIEKVRFSSSRPPRITLLLKKESKFGNSITFTPPPRMILFGPHPIVKDLNERLKVLRLS